MSSCCRASSRTTWRRRRGFAPSHPKADATPFVDCVRAVRAADPMLKYPDAFDAPMVGLGTDSVIEPCNGLPRLAAALLGSLGKEPLRVCYLGGSITEQRTGYRPRVTRWLESQAAKSGVRLEEVPAFCGNCGSKVLAFMIADWVVARRPHLVFIELAINDGDTLLETEDPESIGSALEGIIRHIRDALPRCELCLLHMFIRDDLPLHQRTGSKAWAENEDAAAAATYHHRVPKLHNRVAGRYGIPSIAMSPVMATLPTGLRQQVFRDDCHMHDPGAAFASSVICAALSALIAQGAAGGSSESGGARMVTAESGIAALPSPVHAKPWGRGRAEVVQPQHLSFFYLQQQPSTAAEMQAVQQRLLARHTQMDMDPLNNAQQRHWWLLYGGDSAEIKFTGTRLGILTMIGPDAGYVTCEVDGGRWRCRLNLLDKWCYFFRLSVVSLLEDLPPGPHHAILRFEAERPSRSILKKPPSGPHWASFQREGKDHKLWMMHWLIEEESELERAVIRAKPAGPEGSRGGSLPVNRLGGASLSTGGRQADAY